MNRYCVSYALCCILADPGISVLFFFFCVAVCSWERNCCRRWPSVSHEAAGNVLFIKQTADVSSNKILQEKKKSFVISNNTWVYWLFVFLSCSLNWRNSLLLLQEGQWLVVTKYFQYHHLYLRAVCLLTARSNSFDQFICVNYVVFKAYFLHCSKMMTLLLS